MRSSLRLLAALGLCLVGLATPARGQGLTGQMSGSVIDGSSSVLPGATVTVTNIGTQAARSVTTDAIWRLHGDRPPGRTVRSHGHARRLQDLRPARRQSVGQRARRAPGHRARGRHASPRRSRCTAEAARIQTLSGERSGVITQDQINDIALKGKDYMGLLKQLPGVVDTAEPRGARLEQPRRPQHQRRPQQHHQPDLRRRHQPRHRIEHRAVPGARHRLDRRDQGAHLELPGRVRPQLRRHHQRHHQERHAASSTAAASTRSATRTSTPTSGRTTSSAGPSRPTASTTAAITSAARWSCSAASTAAATSCSSSGTRSSCRAPTPARSSAGRCRPSSSGAATSRNRSTPTAA